MTRILIVDDVYTVRLKTELVLRHAGRYTVQSASNGPEAIRLALAEAPDLIIMDIAMAGMDGYATLRELRKHGVRCPVIAFSCCRKASASEDPILPTFDAWIAKTDNMTGLMTAIREILLQQPPAPHSQVRPVLLRTPQTEPLRTLEAAPSG